MLAPSVLNNWGKVIVEKLTEDFEILDRFLIIKKILLAVYYESYVDL